MTKILTTEDAESLEAAFLGGLEEAQFAYERIVEHEAWALLGFERFADWWDERVTPSMRALSMRPTREIAAAVVEQVRKEEAELPPAQRRTQRELAAMVGVERSSLASRDGSRSVQREESPQPDLELAPDEEEPPLPVEFPKGQERGVAFMAGIDAGEDARRDAELAEVPDVAAARFRSNFATALRRAGELRTFEPDRVAEVFASNFHNDIGRSLESIREWCDQVERVHRERQRTGLRLISGGAA